MDIGTISVIMAMAGLALAAMAVAIGQGMTISAALQGMSRQPDAAGKISNSMIVGLAFIESVVIYVLVIALIVFFADPFAKTPSMVEKAKGELEIVKLELERVKLEAELAEIKANLSASPAAPKPLEH
jgi:F-type H+-transporting ATPase subunit c